MSAQRFISWFSCGAASAVATKLAIEAHGDAVRVVYFDTGSEHSDNARFMADCSDWFGCEIETARSAKYTDIWDVFEKSRYLVGTGGARCTSEMKRKVGEAMIDFGRDQQIEVFGYTADEKRRVAQFIEHNTERKIWPVLSERGITKDMCYKIIKEAGIELPEMYRLGYNNNNCIGCVKGGAGYWNKIRVDFPDTFDRMAKMERELNASINKTYAGDGQRKRLFLDEMAPDHGRNVPAPAIDCGIICQVELFDEVGA
jgi:hypothetical protein